MSITVRSSSKNLRDWYHEIASSNDGSLPNARRNIELGNEAICEVEATQNFQARSYTNSQGQEVYCTSSHCTSAALI